MFVRVVGGTNQAQIAGAQATARGDFLMFACDGSVKSSSLASISFSTNETEWYQLQTGSVANYSLSVILSGESHTFTAGSPSPARVECASLHLPSGVTNVTTISGERMCPPRWPLLEVVDGGQLGTTPPRPGLCPSNAMEHRFHRCKSINTRAVSSARPKK